jgi:hypothetical protein
VWPALPWPDRVHEVSVGRHGRDGLDAGARRRADEGDLLEEGALHLVRAQLAERDMRRAAARRAEALAAFARARPAAVLDRAPGELGAASAASRAARPAALTEVSEWAADEGAVALAASPTGVTRLLEQCVVLVEQLPARAAALAGGRRRWPAGACASPPARTGWARSTRGSRCRWPGPAGPRCPHTPTRAACRATSAARRSGWPTSCSAPARPTGRPSRCP